MNNIAWPKRLNKRCLVYILAGLFQLLYFVYIDFFLNFMGKRSGIFILAFIWLIPGKHALKYFAPLYVFMSLWFGYYDLVYMLLMIIVLGGADYLNSLTHNKKSTLTFGTYFFIDFLNGNIQISWYDIISTVLFVILLILVNIKFEILGSNVFFWIESSSLF